MIGMTISHILLWLFNLMLLVRHNMVTSCHFLAIETYLYRMTLSIVPAKNPVFSELKGGENPIKN